MKKTIGGDRLGAGKKMQVDLKTYNRSTHNLSYIWRSTMASGTLVPFMSEVGLPGDTFDINLDADIKTHPTVGPLFGSYKVQLDVFQVPVRLYQRELHNNELGIGMKMNQVKLPQVQLRSKPFDASKDPDNQQINPSCIFSYLNIRGLGQIKTAGTQNEVIRNFNAIPYLAYWDIYKNYYANKQEEVGAVIHNEGNQFPKTVENINVTTGTIGAPVNTKLTFFDAYAGGQMPPGNLEVKKNSTNGISITYKGEKPDLNDIYILTGAQGEVMKKPRDIFAQVSDQEYGLMYLFEPIADTLIGSWTYIDLTAGSNEAPKVKFFPLENIDKMRNRLLTAELGAPVIIANENTTVEPYNLPLKFSIDDNQDTKLNNQEGLGLKTYQSDLFNNWLSTEWIDGDNGINAITAIDTTEGSFSIDQLQLSKKVYDMLNRIAISGGSYDDWQDAVYSHSRQRAITSPVYQGGLIKELVFQEVVSNAEAQTTAEEQPLGTLAGKGVMGKKNKGGRITIKVDEPSYIMGIISLTPRVDYSQGNKWDTNLQTMDDFHKPALDEIGFQDLITDQMAWFDTPINVIEPEFKSAGKQPAWINYMTNVNQTRGNFAIQSNEMFMTLNRRYEYDAVTKGIKDLTTYIDPMKFNHIFAQTSRDAQNFWTQIAVDITARRKMSAKIMPNL